MADETPIEIKYKLEKFESLDYSFSEPHDVPEKAWLSLNTHYHITDNYDKFVVVFRFEVYEREPKTEDEKPFLSMKARITFDVNGLKNFVKDEKIDVPDRLQIKLSDMAFGMVRGVLFAKTLDTKLKGYILPPVSASVVKFDYTTDEGTGSDAPLSLEFNIYPASDELAKTFKPNLLRYGILVRNGKLPEEIFDYWVEDMNGKRISKFIANPRVLPYSLSPHERHLFQYIGNRVPPVEVEDEPWRIAKLNYPPVYVRACVRLDGPNGKEIKSEFAPFPERPREAPDFSKEPKEGFNAHY
jgi:hypothetical protein